VALDNILRLGRTLMVFFDELTRPVARAECVLSSPECAACSEMISMPGQRYVGAWTALLEEVLDEVQSHSDPHIAAASKHRPAFVTIPLTLSRVETAKMTAIGLNDIIDFRLDDPDEGRGFEQSTWHLLENLFGPMLYHSPQFLEGCSPRELTDIMAVASTGLCLFEAKNAAILSTRLDRTTVRRTTSVQKQIDKGVVQLSGALRTLNNGLPLQTKKGVPLILGPATGQHRHAIVMVSEMLPGVDWEAIGTQLLTAAQRSGAMFHILDLRELRVLVGISRNDPARFIAQLTHRFGVMTVRKHAMLRTRLTGPPLP